MTEILKMSGVLPITLPAGGSPAPYDILFQASCHLNSSQALVQGFLLNGYVEFFWPAQVLELFALELFLKCLYHSGRPEVPRLLEHSPHELFIKHLNNAEREMIEREYAKVLTTIEMEVPELQLDLMSVLVRMHKLFERMRYLYEGARWGEDSSGTSGTGGLDQLTLAVRNSIIIKFPDWHFIFLMETLQEGPSHGVGKYEPHPNFIERQYRAQGRMPFC